MEHKWGGEEGTEVMERQMKKQLNSKTEKKEIKLIEREESGISKGIMMVQKKDDGGWKTRRMEEKSDGKEEGSKRGKIREERRENM